MKKQLLNCRHLLGMLVMLLMGVSAWGEEVTEGFENASTSTYYQGTVNVDAEHSDSGIAWEINYGAISTTNAISGKSVALRLYSGDNTYGYLKNTTPVEGMAKVVFSAKAQSSNSAEIKYNVDYSTDGTNWTTIKSNEAPETSAATYSYDIPEGGKYFRIQISSSSTKPKTSSAQLTIDNIVITTTTSRHNVTWSVNGTTTTTQVAEGAAIAFASNPEDMFGKTFVGWTESEMTEVSNVAPTMVTSATMGTEDKTYYAVFAEESSNPVWIKITNSTDIVNGIYAIVSIDENYYLPNVSATSACPKTATVTKTDSKIDTTEDMKWNLTISGGKINLESAANGGQYLWGGSANDATRVNENSSKANATKDWYVEETNDYGIVLYNKATTDHRYLSTYGTSDWRNYTSTSTTNRAANLYKYESNTSYSNYATSVGYTRNVTEGNYGTICLPCAVEASDIEGATIYSIAGKDDSGITLAEETRELVAGKPYLFKATATILTARYKGSVVNEAVEATGLVGNLSATSVNVPEGCYVISKNQLRKVNGGTATIGQNRAYINLDGVGEATVKGTVFFGFDGSMSEEEDGIVSMKDERMKTAIYDMQGRQVSNTTKGLYIKNGRKYMVK